MEEIVKKLAEIEDSLEFARKMVDWGEYERDPQSFANARLTIRNAIDEISSIRKSLKIIIAEEA